MKKIIMMVMVLCMGLGMVGCNSKITKDVKLAFADDTVTLSDGKKGKLIGIEMMRDIDPSEFESILIECLTYLDEDLDELTIVTFPKGDKNSRKVKINKKDSSTKQLELDEQRCKNGVYTIGLAKTDRGYDYYIVKYKKADEGVLASGTINIDK